MACVICGMAEVRPDKMEVISCTPVVTSWGSMAMSDVVKVVNRPMAASIMAGARFVTVLRICSMIPDSAVPRAPAAPASPFRIPRKASATDFTPGTRSASRDAPSSLTSVKMGSIAPPTSAMDVIHSSFAWFARITSALVSRYFSAASE